VIIKYMNIPNFIGITVMSLFLAGTVTTAQANETQAESTHYDELAQLPFPGSYPTKAADKKLKDELAFQRGVQSYLWALPAMNMYAMREGMRKTFGATDNTLMISKNLIDSNFRYTTGNPDVIYAFSWLDLKKNGPTVLEMPPKMQGLLDDMWHRPITDIGAAGPDKNKGGKYLVIPTDYKGNIPDGYHVVKSRTHGVFVFLRAFLVDGKPDQGVALLEQSKIYPLSKINDQSKMRFPDLSGVFLPGDFPRNIDYFKNLSEMISYETVEREHFDMRGMLAGIGIEKGKPFKPDANTKALLDKAAKVGFKMAANVDYNYYPNDKIYPDRVWEQTFIGGSPTFEKETYHNLDASIAFFHSKYSTSKSMVLAMPGKGSQYLMALRDSDENLFYGQNTYKLHMPAGIPAGNFWSFVVYDADTRALLDNGMSVPSIASNRKATVNKDGSVDVYFGPKAPKDKKANWIKTVPGKGWFGAIRLYSPTKAFFDQTWKPDNIKKVK
jgi:hypothetical protein